MSKGKQDWAFKKFIEANQAMLACFEKQDAAEFSGANASKAASVCQNEKTKVKNSLNELSMTRLVQDRVSILRSINTKDLAAGKYQTTDEPLTRYH